MKLIAIDPGTTQSAYAFFMANSQLSNILDYTASDILDNQQLIHLINTEKPDEMAIEMVASYGMAVGKSVFETVFWIGRFWETAAKLGCKSQKIYRKDVKIYLCKSMKAKDANIRQAIIDKFPASGSGKIPQIGTKSKPGPLYGVSKDMWSAIAVGLTYAKL
jgi:hypothetical protein